MHIEARRFTLFVKNCFPDYFTGKKCLDVGGGDINGNNSDLFEDCEVEVNDVYPSKNVTRVCRTKDLPFSFSSFHTIISTECFEHDPEYSESLSKIYDMLIPHGLFVFTCASTGRPEHGTRKTTPYDSLGTIGNIEDMVDYYKNLTIEDIDKVLKLDNQFTCFDAYYNEKSKDLYFIGFKYGNAWFNRDLPKYYAPGVTMVKSSRIAPSMERAFDSYQTDKNSSQHNYIRQYDFLLKPYENRKVRVLEIGVYKGQSLLAWREYFPYCEKIVGVDIDPKCKRFENPNKQIYVEISRSENPSLIETLKEKYIYFDIIIDDGSHIFSEVVETFKNLFTLLRDGGIYIVEDTVCYNKPGYIFNPKHNHLDFFTSFIPYLNQWKSYKDPCIDPFKIEKTSDKFAELCIDKIEFGCSYIAITKRIRYHWLDLDNPDKIIFPTIP